MLASSNETPCFARLAAAFLVSQSNTPFSIYNNLEDDFCRTLAPARFIAATVPGARLITYASGGHVFVGHEADAFAEVDAFLRQN